MSAKRFPDGLEVYDLGTRRMYVKPSTGFVLHNDDLSPEELVQIATDIAGHEHRPSAPLLAGPIPLPAGRARNGVYEKA
jgi:hypothetical protein